MRLAVAGKGGAGKTTISATLARHTARQGRPVVAIDADANPNLSTALGLRLPVDGEVMRVPTSLVSRRPGGPGLTESIDTVLQRYALRAPDDVWLLGMGAPPMPRRAACARPTPWSPRSSRTSVTMTTAWSSWTWRPHPSI